jgi:hypothetical protein
LTSKKIENRKRKRINIEVLETFEGIESIQEENAGSVGKIPIRTISIALLAIIGLDLMRIQSLKIRTKALETISGIESIQEGDAKSVGKTRIRIISFALLATKGPVVLRIHK